MCPVPPPEKSGEEELSSSRRNFLKLILTLSGVAAVGSVASVFRILEYIPSATAAPTSWPIIKITNISKLDPATPLRFNYPLVDTPNVLIKTGVTAENGVGPDSDIVAFSNYCQHLGCVYSVLPVGSSPPCSSMKASSVQGYCCCHGGQYDYIHSGKVIGGPPPRAVPRVMLSYDDATGDISAIGMSAPTIFGKGPAGTSDPALVLRYDCTGGDIVTEATLFSGTK